MILLDTHMLVWMLVAPEKLSSSAKMKILDARRNGPLFLSAISLWEIAWLVENRRVETELSTESFVAKCASYVQIMPITPQIAARSFAFPATYPSDPQDRIIGATAIMEGLRLLTRDKRIRQSRLVPLA